MKSYAICNFILCVTYVWTAKEIDPVVPASFFIVGNMWLMGSYFLGEKEK